MTVTKRYVLAESTIDGDDIAGLVRWLESDPRLTQGDLVREFEARWAEWLGTRYAVFVNSGSSANLLMYYAALLSGRLRNNRVAVSAASWATTVAPAIQLGFEPLMCDADRQTFGPDIDDLERVLREHDPATVIIVHTLGVPARMDRLLELRERHRFLLLEDACPALGSSFRGRRVGGFGEMSSMSFYFGHHLSTIEGGMVSTDDEELHDILLHLRSHGWAKDLDPAKEEQLARRHGALEFNRVFTFYYPGFNCRSTDLNAHLGLSQLRKVERVVARRVENQLAYEERFRADSRFHVPRNPDGVTCSISFAALASSLAHRDAVGRALDAAGVETRPIGGGSMARQPFWVQRYGERAFPVGDAIHERSFVLPNHPDLGIDDVNRICDVVLAVHVPAE